MIQFLYPQIVFALIIALLAIMDMFKFKKEDKRYLSNFIRYFSIFIISFCFHFVFPFNIKMYDEVFRFVLTNVLSILFFLNVYSLFMFIGMEYLHYNEDKFNKLKGDSFTLNIIGGQGIGGIIMFVILTIIVGFMYFGSIEVLL